MHASLRGVTQEEQCMHSIVQSDVAAEVVAITTAEVTTSAGHPRPRLKNEHQPRKLHKSYRPESDFRIKCQTSV